MFSRELRPTAVQGSGYMEDYEEGSVIDVMREPAFDEGEMEASINVDDD